MGSLSTLNLQGLPDLGPRARQALQWAPAALSLLAACLIGHTLAVLAWTLVPVPEAARWRPPPASAPANPAMPAQASIARAADLFGHFVPVPVNPGANALSAAPDTALDLQLLGILANSRYEDRSRALIKAGDAEEKPFAVGESVAQVATVKAIFPDRVLLLRNGALETLRMHRHEDGSGGVSPLAALAATPATQATESLPEKLSRIRTQVLANPNDANTYIHINPVPAGSGQPGYRVFPGVDNSLFSPDGLHAGDLITDINGHSLADPAKALQLVSGLSTAQSVTLTVVRGRAPPQQIIVNFAN